MFNTDIVLFIVCKMYFLLVLSKRLIRCKETCRDYVTKITTALKIAVDSVTTLLAPFSWRQPIKFNPDFEERKLLLIAMVQ